MDDRPLWGRAIAAMKRDSSEKACIRMIELTGQLSPKHKREMRDYLQAVIELDERTAGKKGDQ